ncbi:aldo/keto reductase [Simiduia litorea]|uniref:aldo/keto reductase n=1 Tax=Simiduia litorea TaxID=1435348 RepID=UPI0036F3BA22
MQQVALTDQLHLSRIIYGWWRLMSWDMNTKAIEQRIEECLALGITSHDHADIYGDYLCEASFGRALKNRPDLREKIQLVSKCGIQLVSPQRPHHARKNYDTGYAHIVASAEQSLINLNTEFLDLLLIHRPDPLMDVDDMAGAFENLQQAGKVGAFGVSNFSVSEFNLLQSRLSFPLVTNQMEISVLHHASFHDGSLHQAQQLKRAPMAWSALAGGRLFSGDDSQAKNVRDALEQIASDIGAQGIDQIALAWLLKHPANIMPIVGSQSLARIQAASDSLNIPLSRAQWYTIWEAAGGELP